MSSKSYYAYYFYYAHSLQAAPHIALSCVVRYYASYYALRKNSIFHTKTGQKMTTEMAVQQTKLAALKQRNSITPDFENWKPNEGQTLLGEIIGGEIFHHTLYGEQRVMKVRSENGALLNVFLNKWLMTALESFAATNGDFIALTFKGKKRTATGNFYNAYALDVEKA